MRDLIFGVSDKMFFFSASELCGLFFFSCLLLDQPLHGIAWHGLGLLGLGTELLMGRTKGTKMSFSQGTTPKGTKELRT